MIHRTYTTSITQYIHINRSLNVQLYHALPVLFTCKTHIMRVQTAFLHYTQSHTSVSLSFSYANPNSRWIKTHKSTALSKSTLHKITVLSTLGNVACVRNLQCNFRETWLLLVVTFISWLPNCHKGGSSWLRLYLSSTVVTFANFTLPERNFSRDPSAGLSNMWRLEPRAMDYESIGIQKRIQLFQSKRPLQDHYQSMHLPTIFIGSIKHHLLLLSLSLL